jgi:hypothetical protein
MAYDFSISSNTLSNGRTVFYAQLMNSDEAKFVIGYRTLYDGNFGLFNIAVKDGLTYIPGDYKNEFGFWAYFIYPTAKAESKGSFFCLNTYDRARFTFGFMQYAAHVPDGDFVALFKKLLQLPNGSAYFPRLVLQDGRIFYSKADSPFVQLESDTSTEALIHYLNPSLSEIENQELICSARMVHWSQNDPDHRRLQVETAIAHFQGKIADYDQRFGLNDAPAKVCQLICDIRHQGRGTNDRIAAALNTAGDYEKAYLNLLTIGNANYSERIKTVNTTIKKLLDEGMFLKKYSSQEKEFVDVV